MNAPNEDDTTPLHVAAASGNLDIVALLVSHGAQADLKDKQGQTPLDIAKDREESQVIQYLTSKSVP